MYISDKGLWIQARDQLNILRSEGQKYKLSGDCSEIVIKLPPLPIVFCNFDIFWFIFMHFFHNNFVLKTPQQEFDLSFRTIPTHFVIN